LRQTIIGCAIAAALSWAGTAVAGTVLDPSLVLTAEERYDSDILLRQEANAGAELLTKLTPQVGLEARSEAWKAKAWYAPDLMFHHGSGSVSLDHRGELSLDRRFSHRLRLAADLKLWRVTDPTSLPRLGLAKTLSPVLYGEADLHLAYSLTERWLGTAGLSTEAARVYEPGGTLGYMLAPYAKAAYRLTRRTNVGGEYRFSYFHLGAQESTAHGLFANWLYRVSRTMTLTASAGPNFYQDAAHPESTGVVPHLVVDLEHAGPRFNWGLAAGHDLVGASGFTAALWADYASAVTGYRLSQAVRVFGGASVFRNGQAPNQGAARWALTGQGLSSGYAVGVGVEWKLSRILEAKATVDRYAQVADPLFAGGPDLSRNVFALRLIATAF
jgi:hypothetical protein